MLFQFILFIVFLVAAGAALVPWKRVKERTRRQWTFALAHPLFDPIALTVFLLIAGSLPTIFDRVAHPNIHDEFAYIFQAKTFASGRLTNPTPPNAESFQTFHLMVKPTFAAKFPPAQAMALAVGVLFHWTILGAFGTVALAGGAMCWALQALVPRRMALLGGVLLGLHPHIFASWGQTYWGGATSMLGGALLLGATLRIIRQKHWSSGVVFGVGLAILANSRPFEGMVLAIMTSIWIGIEAFRAKDWMPLLRRSMIPAAAVMFPVVMWMGYYNYRVTGHATRMPYVEHASQYMHSPLFFWGKDNNPPTTRIPKMDGFHKTMEYNEFNKGRTFKGFMSELNRKFGIEFSEKRLGFIPGDTFLPLTWLVVLPAIFIAARRRSGAFMLAMIFLYLAIHTASTPFLRTHYLGPITALWFCLITLGIYQLLQMRKPFPMFARAGVIGLLTSCVVMLCLYFSQNNSEHFPLARYNFVTRLEQLSGQHLVLIEYDNGPQRIFEWVYNEPDIENAKIVFAHVIDQPQVDGLLKHFEKHSRWVLRVSQDEVKIMVQPQIVNATQPTTP